MTSCFMPGSFVRSAQSTSDLYDRWRRHPVSLRQHLAAFLGISGCFPFGIGQLRVWVSFSNVRRSVQETVRRVFGRGGPPQISRHIIVGAAVVVGDLRMAGAPRRFKERLSHEAVNINTKALVADFQPHVGIAPAIAPSGANPSVEQPHTSEARNLVAGCALDASPFLVHHENIAHERVKYNKPGAWQ